MRQQVSMLREAWRLLQTDSDIETLAAVALAVAAVAPFAGFLVSRE